jgi:hypothetical protein
MNHFTTSTPVSLLAPWSTTTTLNDWWALPADLCKRTVLAAAELPLALKGFPAKRAAEIRAVGKGGAK